MANQTQRRHSDAELRAMAYHIVDLIETRALALQKENPALPFDKAMFQAFALMAQGRQA